MDRKDIMTTTEARKNVYFLGDRKKEDFEGENRYVLYKLVLFVRFVEQFFIIKSRNVTIINNYFRKTIIYNLRANCI